MRTEDFDRLNTLSKKSITDTLTPTELNEFKILLTLWNENLLQIFDRAHAVS